MDSSSPDSRDGWRIFLAPSILAAFFYFACLWRLDFPQPGYDDLFYTGAALNLAGGGDYSNPLLARQGFPTHYFFVYPPLHSYALAGWLKIFGVRTASQTGFAILNLLVICAATIAILRRRQAPRWVEWLVPMGVSFALMPLGLRADAMAVALTLTGFALADWGGALTWRHLAGFFLMFLGASCSPRVTPFAGALAACAGYEFWQSATGKSAHWKICAFWLAGLAGAGLVFLVLINFRLHEFLRAFQFHSTRIAATRYDIVADYVKHILGILQWPLVLLPLALFIDALRKSLNRSIAFGVFIGGGLLFAISIRALGAGTIWWAILMMLILTPSFVKTHAPASVRVLQLAMVFALLLANRKLFAQCYGLLSGNIVTSDQGEFQQAATLRPTPEHPVLVDGAVARYVFDYRLPAGFLDVEFGTPFPGQLPGDIDESELRPGDVFVTGPVTTRYLAVRTHLNEDTPMWSAWGMGSLSFDKFPKRIYVIHAEDCKGRRENGDDKSIYVRKHAH